MLEGVDQHEADIASDGSVVLPATLLGSLKWRAGMRVLLEETDEGILITPIDVPGDSAEIASG